MNIFLHKNFKKQYKKLRKTEQDRFKKRRDLFILDPFHPILNNHALHGKYQGCRSINITGDLRAIYKEINTDTFFFIALGTPAELYE